MDPISLFYIALIILAVIIAIKIAKVLFKLVLFLAACALIYYVLVEQNIIVGF